LFAQIPISGGELIIALSKSFGFQGVKHLSVVDSGDKPIGDSADGFIEVHLGSEGIKGSLRRQRRILRGDGSLNQVKWDGQWWGVRWGLVG
jgi:hypothetical protein